MTHCDDDHGAVHPLRGSNSRPRDGAISGGIEAFSEGPDLEAQCVKFQEYQQRAVPRSGDPSAVDFAGAAERRPSTDPRGLPADPPARLAMSIAS